MGLDSLIPYLNSLKCQQQYLHAIPLADWKQALDTLNSQPLANDFNTLSIAAKIYYIVNRQGRATTEQIQEVAKEYDWDIDDSQIESVRSFLEDLSLISVGEPT